MKMSYGMARAWTGCNFLCMNGQIGGMNDEEHFGTNTITN